MDSSTTRYVLLNWLLSTSVTQARGDDAVPPTHGMDELLGILDLRRRRGHAIEFFGIEDEIDDDKRLERGANADSIALTDLRIEKTASANYAFLLLEYVDESARDFAVVDRKLRKGRRLAGTDNERGSTACHLVVKMPPDGSYDEGKYRCAIEYLTPITRRLIEVFLSRQVRRHARANGWDFEVSRIGKRGKPLKSHRYKYYPKLDLAADVGRTLGPGASVKTLSQLVFTNRKVKQSVGGETTIAQEDVFASVDVRISAKQGPSDESAMRAWVKSIIAHFKERGYEAKLLYRHTGGSVVSGELKTSEEEGAADLLLCPKEPIMLSDDTRWVEALSSEVCDRLREVVDREDLWSPVK